MMKSNHPHYRRHVSVTLKQRKTQTMKAEDVMHLPGRDNPVLCADGQMGMLLIYPNKDDGRCGVQVHGEEEHRWIAADDLTATDDGALREEGSPKFPNGSSDLVQTMLMMDWISRGGESMP